MNVCFVSLRLWPPRVQVCRKVNQQQRGDWGRAKLKVTLGSSSEKLLASVRPGARLRKKMESVLKGSAGKRAGHF